jgi:hypothetical protein
MSTSDLDKLHSLKGRRIDRISLEKYKYRDTSDSQYLSIKIVLDDKTIYVFRCDSDGQRIHVALSDDQVSVDLDEYGKIYIVDGLEDSILLPYVGSCIIDAKQIISEGNACGVSLHFAPGRVVRIENFGDTLHISDDRG